MPGVIESAPCSICQYPVSISGLAVGDEVRCPYCGGISQVISEVSTGSAVLAGVIGFIVGVVVGPSFLLGIKAGQEALERKARSHIR